MKDTTRKLSVMDTTSVDDALVTLRWIDAFLKQHVNKPIAHELPLALDVVESLRRFIKQDEVMTK